MRYRYRHRHWIFGIIVAALIWSVVRVAVYKGADYVTSRPHYSQTAQP